MKGGMGTSGFEDNDVPFGMCPNRSEEDESNTLTDPRTSGLNFNCISTKDVEDEIEFFLRRYY